MPLHIILLQLTVYFRSMKPYLVMGMAHGLFRTDKLLKRIFEALAGFIQRAEYIIPIQYSPVRPSAINTHNKHYQH